MSGRSGYRKTDRKRNRFAKPAEKFDYILRFQLPHLLAAFLSPGIHGWGVAIGYNDTVFVEGKSPAHCCQLAADFFEKIEARRHAQSLAPIAGRIVKLLPCSAHCGARNSEGFNKLNVDLEAIHDRVSRFGEQSRPVSVDINPDSITFAGQESYRFRVVHDFADAGYGRQAQ